MAKLNESSRNVSYAKYLIFSADWSKPSNDLVDMLTTFAPFFEGKDVEVKSLSEFPVLHQKYAIRVWPTIIKLEGENEVARAVSLDFIGLVEFMK